MARQKGLLEESFDEAFGKIPGWIKTVLKDCAKNPVPAEAPKTAAEALARCYEVYRENQVLADEALVSSIEFLSSQEGPVHVKALQGALVDREPTTIGREIATRMYDAPQFQPLRKQLDSTKLEAFGLGLSGSAFLIGGLYGGVEYIFGDPETELRWWYGVELEIVSGIDIGISTSFWIDQAPLTGCNFGFEVDLSRVFTVGTRSIPAAVKFTVFLQRAEYTTKYKFAGFSLQVGLGITYPWKFGVGAFLAHQGAAKRRARATMKVTGSDGTSTIAVATPNILTFKIDFNQESTTFNELARMNLNLPKSFGETDLANFTIPSPPDHWSFLSVDASSGSFSLQADSQVTYNAGDSVEFSSNTVEASGQLNTGTIEKGTVSGVLQSTNKYSLAVSAPLDVAWQTFSASLNWSAIIGTSGDYDMTFTTSGCSPTQCSGTNTTAYSQNSTAVTCLAEASDGTYTWCFGYQYDYSDPGNTDNVGQLRAAIWREDLPVATAAVGKYVQSGGSTLTTSATLGSSADGPTITITVAFN